MATIPFAPTPVVLHSCYVQAQRATEFYVAEHVLLHLLSGTFIINSAGVEQTFRTGDTVLLKRHELMRGMKYPEPEGEYNSVSLVLDQATLHRLHHLGPSQVTPPLAPAAVIKLPRHPLFTDLANSIITYNAGQAIPQLPALKAQEAILLVLHLQPELGQVLFDFSEPGKLDLAQYMTQHFRFNLSLLQFAFLTGRSLATFKRDFRKVFYDSPSRWLQQQRLAEAHYLLRTRKLKPSDVYLDVGFENLSHFSTAFKKRYGYPPSQALHLTR
jgi:AraC-like DNA-binding protein